MHSDDQLINQILNGNSTSFRELMSKYQNYMYSVCLSILKTKTEAEEATQDTFVKIYRSLDKYNSESKFSSWAYKIAYRTSLDYIRKRKPTTELEKVAHSDHGQALQSDKVLFDKEVNNQILSAINRLPGDEAGLIRMFYLEEMKTQELVEASGLSKSNVKVKLFRARKKLAEIIHSQFPEIESYFETL
jgi:RNA polymerase sigma-70 factor (ECF subfamily)